MKGVVSPTRRHAGAPGHLPRVPSVQRYDNAKAKRRGAPRGLHTLHWAAYLVCAALLGAMLVAALFLAPWAAAAALRIALD